LSAEKRKERFQRAQQEKVQQGREDTLTPPLSPLESRNSSTSNNSSDTLTSSEQPSQLAQQGPRVSIPWKFTRDKIEKIIPPRSRVSDKPQPFASHPKTVVQRDANLSQMG